MADITLNMPNTLSGICLDKQHIQSMTITHFHEKKAKKGTITAETNFDLSVKPNKKTSIINAKIAYTIKISELVDGKETILSECLIQTLTSYILPRGNVQRDDIQEFAWFFAYMGHSFIHRTLKEAFVDTDFKDVPIPFVIEKEPAGQN